MKKLSLILFSLSILFFTNYSQTEEKLIYGKAKVIDGDTIKINGQNIRLQGIDAPEMKQSCKDQNNSSYACGQVSKIFRRINQICNGNSKFKKSILLLF